MSVLAKGNAIMLVDVPFEQYTDDIKLSLIAYFSHVIPSLERLYRGIYLSSSFNAGSLLLEPFIVEEYPFTPPLHKNANSRSLKKNLQLMREIDKVFPSDYGVIDYPRQVAVKYPVIDTCNKSLCVVACEVRKQDQPSQGGWRWHKWGEYIGDLKPRCEYLHDEPEIERVFTYHIYEVNPER